MKTLHKNLIGLLGAASVMMSSSAFALPVGWSDSLPAWSSTASACTVDESSNGRHEFSVSQFRFLGANINGVNNSGLISLPVPITVRCNVTPMYDYVPAVPYQPGNLGSGSSAYWKNVSWNSLIVGYKDPDGKGIQAQVSASLRKVNRATQLENVVASFNSNSFADTVPIENVTNFIHAFDFQKNEYYVEINLYRTTTSIVTPVAYSVRLTNGSAVTGPN